MRNNIQKSLVIVKPDGVKLKVVGEIISRFEKIGLDIEKIEMTSINRELACKHYCAHTKRDFFEKLIDYVTSGPAVVMIISGEEAISRARDLMGPTDSREAEKGTIRGDYGKDNTINVIHGSDSEDSARREIELFFE